jgi:hypothetical protein
MPSLLSPAVQRLPVAPCLDAAIGLFRAALLTCLPYGVLFALTSQLPQIYGHLHGPAPGWWVIYLASGVLSTLFLNAILLRLAAVAGEPGPPPQIRRELPAALARVPACIGLIAVMAAASTVLVAAAFLVPAAGRAWVAGVGLLGAIYLGAMLSCAWVELVLEGRGLPQSIHRSLELVRGNAWRVVAAGLIGALILLVLALVAAVFMDLIVHLVGSDDVALISSVFADVLVACTAVAAPFVAALLFTLHRQLAGLQRATPAAAAASAPE